MTEHRAAFPLVTSIVDGESGALRPSKLRELIDHLPVLIAYIDREGRYRFSSRQHQIWWGLPENDIVGRFHYEVTGAEAAKKYGGPLNQALQGTPVTFENFVVYPGVGERHVQTSYVPDANADGEILGVFVLVTDVTAIKKSEMERKVIFDSAPAYIWYKDKRNRILRVNRAAADLMGKHVDEIEGADTADLFPNQASDFHKQDLEVIETATAKLGIIEQIESDRGMRWLQTDKVPFYDESGHVSGVIVFSVDITDRVKAEQERAVLEQQLLESQKMEALGTLAGGIAHDFNNMLAGILGYAALARMEVPPGSPLDEYLENIDTSASRARDLVQQILTFSKRPSSTERTVLDVKALCHEVLTLLRATIPSSISVRTQFPSDDCFVLCNASQLHQVVLNVATNATYAMREHGGSLDISVSQTVGNAFRGAIPELSPSGRYIHFMIADTGEGMSEDVRQRIFEPYFTTKPVGDGSGLGLAVVHGIVLANGGSIRVDSAPGRGTRFHIFLPECGSQDSGNHTRLTLVSENARDLPKGFGRILFVDDEPVLAQLGKDLLSSLGYAVATCHSGVTALQLIRESPSQWDLLITDQTMPRMTGDELIRIVKDLAPGLPAILTTGYSDTVGESRARDSGASAYLVKPYRLEQLATLCDSFIAKRSE